MASEIPFDRSLIPPGSRVLCAVSGGADSVCLLHLVLSLEDVACACAHYDHGLRPESARDAAFTAGLCEKWGVPFFTERGDVAALARERGLSTETAAREARYAFLYRTAAAWGADRIATAHTMNDNAETILFRMARGTGLRGLTGIPEERGILVRPLLHASRAQVEEYLRRRGIPWTEDATNALDDAARNRVRHRLLPDLAAIHPGALENTDRMIRSLREDEAYLTSLAADWLAKQGDELPAGELRALPRSVSARVLRLWLGGELSAERLEAVLELCGASPSAMLDLPGRRIWRRGEVLTVKEPKERPLPEREIRPEERLALPEAGLELECLLCPPGTEIQSSFRIFSFSSANIYGKLTVASRSPGEKITLRGRKGARSLKKMMTEAKIPRAERSAVPVIRDEAGVLAVYGLGQSPRAFPAGDEPFYLIKFRELSEEHKE